MSGKISGLASTLCLVSILGASMHAAQAAPGPAKHDTAADQAALVKWITSASGCDAYGQLTEINDLQYYDFNHDGKDELLVTASTCNTGTAGPDVHSVFFRNADGTFREYPLPDVDAKYYADLIGNRNYVVEIRHGQIIATWHDRSNRPLPPLVITYAWNGRNFVPQSIQAPYLH